MGTLPSSKIAPSLIRGFFIGLVAMGLPMIGVTVNIYLGAILLAVAFILFAYGFWIWTRAHKWGIAARTNALWALAIIYFALIGYQIVSQYKKDHSAPQPPIVSKVVAPNTPTGNVLQHVPPSDISPTLPAQTPNR